MKLGIRKTNYKRRAKNTLFKATIGITPATAKRRVKKQVVPLYGTKKSVVLNPKKKVSKKVYNKVYNKTSFSIWKK